MDSPQTSPINQPAVSGIEAPPLPSPPPSVSELKARFLSEAKKIDFLEPIKKHPIATVTGAAVLGVVAGVVTSAFARPKVVVKHVTNERNGDDSSEPKPSPTLISTLFSLVQPLLWKAGQSAAAAWLAQRQTNVQDPSTETVGQYE